MVDIPIARLILNHIYFIAISLTTELVQHDPSQLSTHVQATGLASVILEALLVREV
jgi:hypothetical protein